MLPETSISSISSLLMNQSVHTTISRKQKVVLCLDYGRGHGLQIINKVAAADQYFLLKSRVMDAKRERELAELDNKIKKAEARRDQLEAGEGGVIDREMLFQANKQLTLLMEKQSLLMQQQLGKSFLCHATSQRNLETIKRVPCIPI